MNWAAAALVCAVLIAPALAQPGLAPGAAADAGLDDWCQAPGRIEIVFVDDFSKGLSAWRVEAQDSRSSARATQVDGRSLLDVQSPAGFSMWLLRELQGDYALRFTAIPQPAPASAGALAGRVSDLNMFWNASEADGSAPRVRDGAFASYDTLRALYVGFGANGNTTTRLRGYDGNGRREQLGGWADGAEAGIADRQGAMNPATRLQPGRPVVVQIVSRQPTAADPVQMRWWANGRLLFSLASQVPVPTGGHFALRTTASRFQFADFRVLQCKKDKKP